MGNRLFILPDRKKKELHDLSEWGNLKNKFSGKTLFRSILFDLEKGDLSALDLVDNRWFYEELFTYIWTHHDVNLKPALKKIAGSAKFSESMRQRASEIEEMIEEFEKQESHPIIDPGGDENEKAINALKILAGTRYPHTTEILRLLRDMSPELKRLAIFLIGKFKITDMIQDVCSCLNITQIQEDALAVLLSFGEAAADELERCYLATAGNTITNKAVMRVLSKVRSSGFFADRVWSSSRHIREFVLATLLDQGYSISESEKERLEKDILDTFGTLAWILSAMICLEDNNNKHLSVQMQKEYDRWKEFLLGLLLLTYNKNVTAGRKNSESPGDDSGINISRLSEIIFGTRMKKDEIYNSGNLRKQFKRIQRYITCDVPQYKNLLEYIINCDYNLLSVWTKACALRSISVIDDENLGQSAVALLFSPEPLLREEAAMLISRSDKRLYSAASGRIADSNREHLDRLINDMVYEKELIYNKAGFLSSCFKGLNDDEILFLAQNTLFANPGLSLDIDHTGGSLIWLFSEGGSDPDVVINHVEDRKLVDIIKDKDTEWSYCYVLPLKYIREFRFQYPDSSFVIFKYIDSKEE